MALQSCATHIHKYVWNSHVFPAPCKDSKYKKAAFWAGLLHIGNLGIASSLMASRNCPSIIPLLTTIFFCWEKSFVGPLIQKKMTWGQLALSAQTLCEFPESRKYVMAKSTLSSCSKMGGPTKKCFLFILVVRVCLLWSSIGTKYPFLLATTHNPLSTGPAPTA